MEDDAHEQNVITEGSNNWEAEKLWFQLRIIELESEIEEMKMKHVTEVSNNWEAEKKWLQLRIIELESELEKMKWKRVEDLKGNERALLIFASKEEAWKLEKKQLLQQIEFLRFHNNEDIYNKADSVAEPSGKVINYSRYLAELKRQKEKVEVRLRNSVAEKRQVDAALGSVTDEMLRLQKEIDEKDAFILSIMCKKDRIGFGDSVMQAELGAKEKSQYNVQSRLRNYGDGEGSRERDAEKWKRLYLGMKLELDNLQLYKAAAQRDNEDHTGGESHRSIRLDGNLDRTHSEEIGYFKRERPAKGKKNEELGKQLILKREKDTKIHRRSPSMC